MGEESGWTAVTGDAVVIGAGMAGLAAARVLADRFARVTVVERDSLPAGADSRAASRRARTRTSC